MPLYEYQCDSCGHRFELIQRFSDPLVEACPSCGGAVRKLPSSPAIQFKGSGWYVTDYAQKGKADAATPESAAGGDGAKGSASAGSGSGDGAKGATAAGSGDGAKGAASAESASTTSGARPAANASSKSSSKES